MATSCVRISNDYMPFKSRVNLNRNNMYSVLFNPDISMQDCCVRRISNNPESVVVLIYNGSRIQSKIKEVNSSLKRLKDIEKLEANWNGYGAKPFSAALIHKCERIIVSSLSVQPSIYPTGRNSIQFQYELKDRSYLEFEIFEDKTMCLQVPERIYSKAKEETLTVSEEARIKEIVDNLYGRNSTKR